MFVFGKGRSRLAASLRYRHFHAGLFNTGMLKEAGYIYIRNHRHQKEAMALVGTSTTHIRAAPSPSHMDWLAFNAQTQMRGDVPGREEVRQHRRGSRCFTSGRCGATCTDYCRVPLDNTGSKPGGERRGGVTLGCVSWVVLGVGC